MPDLLLELRSEEIPARMQAAAAAQLRDRIVTGLAQAALSHGEAVAHATPRRLALLIRDLAPTGASTAEERRGPRSDAPPQAIEGFLRSTGLARDQIEERDTPKGRFLYATLRSEGRPAATILAELVPTVIRAFDWPKSMRWGEASRSTASLRWVRPLSGIAALLDGEIIPFEIDGLTSGRTTAGHRFLSTGPVEIATPAAYAATLRAAHVVLDPAERVAIIEDRARALAAAKGLSLVEDPALAAENAGLTEWPVPLLGDFDPAYLAVPPEIIRLTMRTNQKYFALTDAAGALAPAFICVSNLETADAGAAIVAGNRKVLAARLADARFFWEQDKAKRLEDHAGKLNDIVFHEKLGTMADKVERVAKLARWLVESGAVPPHVVGRGTAEGGGGAVEQSRPSTPAKPPLHRFAVPLPAGGEERTLADLAERAARLAKADLPTATVGEFPELQGVIGRYLALAQGEPPEVADAIRDHYKPAGPTDRVPTAPVSVAVALADKLDTLAQFFRINERPTGSRDPFALRRAALGAAALIVQSELRLSVQLAVEAALARAKLNTSDDIQSVVGGGELWPFLVDRLKVQQREAGVRPDIIDAVFALGGEDDLVRLLARVRALQAVLQTEDGTNLLAGLKRAANILRIEDAKDGPHAVAPDPALYAEPAERALAAALDTTIPAVEADIAAERFEPAMAALAALRPAVDAFFDAVTVNAPDSALRRNRLALLARLRDAAARVADFSRIEG